MAIGVRADRAGRPVGAESTSGSDPDRSRNPCLGRRRNDGCAREFQTASQPPRSVRATAKSMTQRTTVPPIGSNPEPSQEKSVSAAVPADETIRSASIPARRDSYRDECRMSILVTLRSLCVVLCFAGLAIAQEPPPLEPPDVEPTATPATQAKPANAQSPSNAKPVPPSPTEPKPANPPATVKPITPKPVTSPAPGATQPAPTRSETGPMLAIPGVTAPTARPHSAARPESPVSPAGRMSPFSPVLDESPSLSRTSPTQSPSRSTGFPPLEALPGASSRDPIPMTIEPLLDEPSKERFNRQAPCPTPSPEAHTWSSHVGRSGSQSEAARPEACTATRSRHIGFNSSGQRRRNLHANRLGTCCAVALEPTPNPRPVRSSSPNGGSSARSARRWATASVTSRSESRAGMRSSSPSRAGSG